MTVIGKIKRKPFIKSIVKNVISLINKKYMIICNTIYRVNDSSIVFTSFGGKSYSDNPRAISEKLHEINPEINIIWLFTDPLTKKKIVPDYVTCLKVNSFKSLKALATSKCWVDNFNKPLFMYKSKEQVYIQTWHGDRGFKKILYDAWPEGCRPYPLIESYICDLAVSGSKYGEMQYKSAFKYNGMVLKEGYPRNDILIENDTNLVKKIKAILGIETDMKILLYAPTLRRESSKNRTSQEVKNIDLMRTLNMLEKGTNKKWTCLVRAHSGVKGLSGIPESDKFIDVSSYEDMSELLLISNVLITDYSSSAGDFALLNRPILLFQSDREEYLENDRGFYFDIDKSPFIVAMNQQELEKIIIDIDVIDFSKNCKEILDFYETYETGNAAKAVANIIDKKLERNK